MNTTEKLYRRYYRAIVCFFLWKGIPQEDATELAQETFMRVHKGRRSYRQESEWNYVLKVAKNIWRNRTRDLQTAKRRGHTESLEDLNLQTQKLLEMLPRSHSTPEEKFELTEELARVFSEIRKLPTLSRSCLILTVFGLTGREVARALKIRPGAVRTYVYQARQELRRQFGKID